MLGVIVTSRIHWKKFRDAFDAKIPLGVFMHHQQHDSKLWEQFIDGLLLLKAKHKQTTVLVKRTVAKVPSEQIFDKFQ